MKYVFDTGTDTREANPLGESTFKMVYELQDTTDDPVKDYNLTFDGNLVFEGDDYIWLLAIEQGDNRCETLYLNMYDKRCPDDADTPIIAGTRIKLSDGTWNLDLCTVSIKVSSEDKYEDLNANKSDTLDIFNVAGEDKGITVDFTDGTIQFEFNDTEDTMREYDSTQFFQNYPDANGNYPGFMCEGDTPMEGWPTYQGKLFNDLYGTELNPDADHAYLNIGSEPHINLYSDPFIAMRNFGWKLYYYQYKIQSGDLIYDATDDPPLGVHTKFYQARFLWVREIMMLPVTVANPGWLLDSTDGVTNKWCRKATLARRSTTVSGRQPIAGLTYASQYNFEQTTYLIGADPDDWFIDAHIYVNALKGLVNGVKLNAVIQQAVADINPDLVVRSNFFQINPSLPSTLNPVTGTASTTDNIIIFQKSDVKRPFDSGHATIGEYTPQGLFNWLYTMFQVKYRIVGTDFLLEAVTDPVLNHPQQYDITVAPYNRMLAGTRIYSYATDALAGKETFEFEEALHADFIGLPILYNGDCVDRTKANGVLDHPLSDITTDIMYVMEYTDADSDIISDEGFCLVSTKVVAGVYQVQSKAGILDSLQRPNNVFGWSYLHQDFYRSNRNAKTGVMNGQPTVFTSTKYIKKQSKLPVILCCISGFDPYASIKTALGTGIITKAEYSVYNSEMTFEVGFTS